MKRTETPRIKFSRWKPWKERDTIKEKKSPGVYLLAHFRRSPRGRTNRYAEEIVYIGISNKSLGDRLASFHRTAFKDGTGHKGARTYRSRKNFNTFKNRENTRRRQKVLYVATFPVNPKKTSDDTLRKCFIRYVERKLIWDYCKEHARRPKCNLE